MSVAAAAVVAGLLAGRPAAAAVVSSTVNLPLSTTPISVTFDGLGGFAFTGVSTGNGPGAAVATTGNGGVTTVFGSVSDFESGSSIDQNGELYTFAGYPKASTIPFSAADDFIGLSVPLADGTHYGYAEVAGSNLVGVGFETAADTTILTGAVGSSSAGISVVPEPTSGLLLCGIVAAAAGKRSGRRRR